MSLDIVNAQGSPINCSRVGKRVEAVRPHHTTHIVRRAALHMKNGGFKGLGVSYLATSSRVNPSIYNLPLDKFDSNVTTPCEDSLMKGPLPGQEQVNAKENCEI